jgi:hypothetical protein
VLGRDCSDESQPIRGSCHPGTSVDILADVEVCRRLHLHKERVDALTAAQNLPGNQDLRPGLLEVPSKLRVSLHRVKGCGVVGDEVEVEAVPRSSVEPRGGPDELIGEAAVGIIEWPDLYTAASECQ